MNDLEDQMKAICSRWDIDYSLLSAGVPSMRASGDERFDAVRRDLVGTIIALRAFLVGLPKLSPSIRIEISVQDKTLTDQEEP